MVARRLVWGLAAAAAALWLTRTARAETESEYAQGPYHHSPAAAAGQPPAKVALPSAKPVRPPGTTTVRRTGVLPSYATESARNNTRLPADEREARAFLRWAATAARFETEASRLAILRAQSMGVREFADDLLHYHESADAELLRLLHVRGMAMPMVDNVQRKTLNRLAKLSGDRFDREFIEVVDQRRQRQEIQQYQKALLGISDPVLRGWIDSQLPTLRLQMAAAGRLSPAEAKKNYATGIKVSARAADRPGRYRVE